MPSSFFILFFTASSLESVTLLVLAFLCFRKHTPTSIYLGFVYTFTFTAMACYVHAFMQDSTTLARFFYFGYYASITLVMNSLYLFTEQYSGIKTKKYFFHLILTLSAADIIILFFMSYFSKLATFKTDYLYSEYVTNPINYHWYFNVHLGLNYIYSLGTICLLVYKSCTSPKHNRPQYVNILIIFLIILFLDAIWLVLKIPVDCTNYFYGLSGILIYFFAYKFKPRNYILKTLKNIVDDSEDILVCFNEEHKCVWYNLAAKNFFNEISDLNNHFETEFEKWRNNTTQFEDMENLFSWHIKVEKNGEILDLELNLHKKFDKLNNYIGCYFRTVDVTETLRKEEEQRKLMGTDSLTGIPNRDFFFSQVRKIIKAKPTTQFLFICSNIIDFKIYNNVFGEEAGNKLLQVNAQRISEKKDVAAAYGRISGDMFAMLLDEKLYHDEPFLAVMKSMEKEFSNTFYHLHMQMGVYRIENIIEPISSMCEKAILSMKIAKGDINNYINWYKEDNLNKNLDEKLVIGKFEQSLSNGDFKIFLQPQVTKDNRILGAEALARWINTDGNIITPDHFIPVLENNGLVSKLDKYLWEEAAKQLSRWKKLGREDLHISVNISVKDFYNEDLYAVFTDLVEKYDIDPKNLKLEITETAVINDTIAINNLLQKLRQFGFEIELDDFGSGYSSLGLLKDISVDVLKIDMSFLQHAENVDEKKAWLILNEIAQLAQVLNMETIVEGVEEISQVEKLTSFGCKVFQGFYFAKPETITSFEERIHLI